MSRDAASATSRRSARRHSERRSRSRLSPCAARARSGHSMITAPAAASSSMPSSRACLLVRQPEIGHGQAARRGRRRSGRARSGARHLASRIGEHGRIRARANVVCRARCRGARCVAARIFSATSRRDGAAPLVSERIVSLEPWGARGSCWSVTGAGPARSGNRTVTRVRFQAWDRGSRGPCAARRALWRSTVRARPAVQGALTAARSAEDRAAAVSKGMPTPLSSTAKTMSPTRAQLRALIAAAGRGDSRPHSHQIVEDLAHARLIARRRTGASTDTSIVRSAPHCALAQRRMSHR